MSRQKKYRLHNFIVDAALVCLTGGFWLIWIFIRETRNSK